MKSQNERTDNMSKKCRILLTALSMILLVCTLASFVGAKDFTDMENHWSKTFVDYGVEKGYINGYENNTFRPDNTVTRAEFSKMINTAIGLKVQKEAEFTDVKTSDWFYAEIGRAVYAGYVSGYSNGTFRPNNTITRQEAAVILHRITLPTSERADLSKYADANDIADWAEEAVSAMSAKGFFAGDQFKCVTPKGGLTRGAAAKLIYQFLETENIYAKSANVGKNASKFSETLIVGDVIADEEDIEIVLDNCRILGNLVIKADDVKVSLHGTVINAVQNDAHGVEIEADKNCEIRSGVTLNGECTLSGDVFGTVMLSGEKLAEGTVELSGNFEKVIASVSTVVKAEDGTINEFEVSDGVNLIIQKGDIKTLNVNSAAKNAVINLVSGVKVEKANVSAVCTFMGKGKIETAYNAVTGVKYETIPENVTGKGVVDSEGNAVGKMTAPTISPVDGRENVSRDTSITINFSNNIYNKSGNTVTESYITSNVRLRKGTSGSYVNCNASITSNRRILLTPAVALDANSTYYVTIVEGAFTDTEGKTNEAFSSKFTTDDDAVVAAGNVTITPANAATGVDLDSAVKLVFNESMYRPNGSTLTQAYLQTSAIELRKGSATGTKLDYTATISSNRTITITPSENFEAATRYYVIVLAGSLANIKGDTVARTTSYFTTENTLIPVVTPGNAQTGVSTLTDIKIEFDTAVTTMSGTSVTQSYIMGNVVEIWKSRINGISVDFTARISSDKKTITVTPYEEFDKGTTYYVVVNDSTLKTSTGAVNEKVSTYFTTAAYMAPVITPASAKTGVPTDTKITLEYGEALYTTASVSNRQAVTAQYIKDNEIVTLRRNSTTGTPFNCDITVSTNGTITLTPKAQLVENAKYYVIVKASKLFNSAGRYNNAFTTYFTTGKSLAPEFTPVDGETDIPVTSNITVYFNESVYQANGSALTNAYIANNVIELHKDNENGETVSFAATLSTDKRTITINPYENLEGNTDYCIVLVPGSLVNGDDIENGKAVSVFTTAASADTEIVFTPENVERGVSTTTDVTIEFASKIYRYGGGAVTQSYAETNIQLRKGSTGGVLVESELVMSSDGKTFTIIPNENLTVNTNYYIIINRNAFQYEDDKIVPYKYSYFQTGTGVPVLSKFSLESAGATSAVFNVMSDTTGTLTITATPRTGSAVTDTFSVTEGTAKTVTLSGLKTQTTYTVTANVKSSATNAQSVVKSVSATTTNAFTAKVTEVTDSTVTVTVNAYSDGELTLKHKNVATGAEKVVFLGSMLNAGGTSKEVITGLAPNTQYEIVAEFKCTGAGEAPVIVKEIVTTDEAEDYLAIKKLIVSNAEGDSFNIIPDGTNATSIIQATDSVKVNVSVTTGATVTVNGKAAESGKDSEAIAVVSGEAKVIPIVVTYEGQTREYTLTVNVG